MIAGLQKSLVHKKTNLQITENTSMLLFFGKTRLDNDLRNRVCNATKR